MTKHIENIFFITIILLAVLLTACSSGEEKAEDNKREAGSSINTPTPTEGVIYTEDELFTTSEQGKEFYVMRVGDTYREIPGACEYLVPSGESPELEDGQIARVVADVNILDGGEEGFCGNILIRELISVTPVDLNEALQLITIPDAATTPLKYENRLLQYSFNGQTYLFTVSDSDIVVYTEAGRYMEYALDTQEDLLSSFFDQLIVKIKEEGTVVAQPLDEAEIKNMPEPVICFYGKLLSEGIVKDAHTPNPLRTEYDLESDAGYLFIGESASRSASDPAAAMEAAEEYWKPLGDNTFENIKQLSENEEFYLFQCDHNYKGEYVRIDTLLVYKTDYYDAETKTCGFEPNEENLRRFVSYGTPEFEASEGCLGIYVTDNEDTIILHRYILENSSDGEKDTLYLRLQEWQIRKSDGRMEYNETYLF